jgi:signal transduction histidine kinase
MAGATVQWRILADVGCALSGHAEPGAALREVAELVVPEAADCCALYLAGDADVPAALAVTHVESSQAGEIGDRLRKLLNDAGPESLLPELNATGGHGSLDPEDCRWLLAELGVPRGLVAPFRFGGRTRGLLVLGRGTPGLDQADYVEFGRALADRVGIELERVLASRRSERAAASSALAVGIVSHDLGNPLATIQICANALLDPEPQPAAGVREIAQIIQRSAAWMQQIIRDLLDRLRLDTGGIQLAREPTAVSEVMGTAQTMFVPVAGDQGLDFAIECAANLPPVDADPQRLQQVLSNLLGNAMKFTPAGGRVVLSARAADDPEQGPAIRFAVSDTGPGIPEQDLPRVFDWFWHSQAGQRTGTGLGLAIAKGVIEAHRAHLMVESTLGRGSTFWFTLPSCETAEGERRRRLEGR